MIKKKTIGIVLPIKNETKKRIKAIMDSKVKIRVFYKGIGRPKKSDYVICKVSEVEDVLASARLKMGFKCLYSLKQNN